MKILKGVNHKEISEFKLYADNRSVPKLALFKIPSIIINDNKNKTSEVKQDVETKEHVTTSPLAHRVCCD